jgi:hypothetical protein
MTLYQQTSSQLELSPALSSFENMQSLDAALSQIFKSRQEETRTEKARRAMAGAVDSLTDEELDIQLTEFQHLIDYWLDMFEQQLFDGKTLQQTLMEG